MKKNLTDIFDEAKVEEIEVLLTEDMADKLDDKALRSIKEEVFLRTDFKKYGTKKRSTTKSWKMFAVAAAACLVLFAGACGVVYAAEVKEYNTAVSFFNDYGLSTAGLSRGEIKAVYKDITTERFEYSKTAEVIAMSITDSQVEGYEILQKMVSPEDVEDWWNYRNSDSYASKDDYTGYDTDWIMRFDENKGYDVFDKSSITKYEDGEVIWNVLFDDFVISGYEEVSDGVIVTGQTPASSGTEVFYAWIMKIDNDGNIKWKNRFDNGFKVEDIRVVIENNDGTYATFGEGDSKYFCFNMLNSEGEVIHFNKAELDGYRVGSTAKLGDGYIMELATWASVATDNQKVVKVDREGNIQEHFSYESDGVYYYIHSLIEYNGKIYLSGYTETMNSSAGTGRGIEPVIKYIYDNDKTDIISEELTPIVRDIYTAMLLVCDVDSGVPEEVYSVKGGLGLWFEYDDAGQLVWYMESIMSTFFSPETNSFTIGGTVYVYRYTFDSNGVLVSEEDTGQRALFRR